MAHGLDHKPEHTPTHFLAQWVQAEAIDADLSIIDTGLTNPITGRSQLRFVPKLTSVTGLTSSSIVLCTTSPVVIIGITHGDIRLASV